MEEEKLYTAGEMAKLAGVSLRTIRFYDRKGILKPVVCSEAGYRYYNRDSVIRLQRILMLKYLGFSLQQIAEMEEGETDVDTQLAQQKNLLRQRKQQLEEMIDTIEIMEKSKEEEKWDYLLRLLNLLTDDEKIKQQYEKADNLERRIKLHEYSTATQDWTDWVYERLNLNPGGTVLEIGCGNGMLWQKNRKKLPPNLHLVLTDRSEGMLEQAQGNLAPYENLLKEKQICIEYHVMDANKLQLPEKGYDCIIANHMLYHVENREECLREIAKALKPTGVFVCATVGERHMEELHDMVAAFDRRIEQPYEKLNKGFRLENGRQQLEKYFPVVTCERQENGLLVDDADAIYDYVYSYPGNAPCILDQRGKEFREMLEERLAREGAVYIRKEQGMFLCRHTSGCVGNHVNESEAIIRNRAGVSGRESQMIDIDNMSNKTTVKEQYKNTSNLGLRKSLHEKYSVNKIGFQKWMFGQYPFCTKMKVLELGSGRGELWNYYFENDTLQSYEMDITLSDFSDGMVDYLKHCYSDKRISVKKIDISDIPFENDVFDLIIANSMLYYVKDIDSALSEVKRVLKKDGLFYCSTFGMNGMTKYLYHAFDELGIPYNHESNISFTLQNGMQLLKKHFNKVERYDYEDALEIDNIKDYLEYIYSMASLQGLDREKYDILLDYFNSKKVNGYLHVPKEYGMFVAGND